MSLSTETSKDNGTVTIRLHGRFDFTSSQGFRKAYEAVPKGGAAFIVDMTDVTAIDSSALGLLVILKEYAGGSTGQVRILGCRPEIKKVLAIANFQRMFRID
jgi:HptB-dependent secretion and biofilm anti anti-sigma factor